MKPANGGFWTAGRKTIVGCVAVGAAVALPLLGVAEAETAPFVTETVRDQALAAAVPAQPTMSDEIDHFEKRVAARPEEGFSRRRLFSARLLAFRAYGDMRHLTEAGRALEAVGEGAFSDAARLALRSGLHLTRHEFQSALATARAGARLSPGDDASYRLFDALWATGGWEEASDVLDRPLDTLSTAYLSRIARVLDGDGYVEQARDRFRRVVENVQAYAEPAPVRAWALVELGNFELHSGSPEAAVRRYREALEILPASPAGIEGLASVAYGTDRDLETARALYRRAVENGAHLDLLPVVADIEDELGNADQASAIRRDFVARATADSMTERLYRRPLAFVLAEDPATVAEAHRLAEEDLDERQDLGAWDASAWVHYRAGDIEQAWDLARRAVSVGAPAPPVAQRAGIIAAAAGERGMARTLLRRALDGQVELSPQQVRNAEQALASVWR